MSRREWFQMLIVTVVAAFLLVFSRTVSAQGNSGNSFAHVQDVQERHTAELMARQGVVGTAVGFNDQNQQAVLVLLENGSVPGIPQNLEGVPVQAVVTGKIEALKAPGGESSSALTATSNWPRPVPIGVSTGNATATNWATGTIGCRVTKGGGYYALSNNHVYALENTAKIGSQVLQPGLYDTGGTYDAANVIGTLAVFVPIQFGGNTKNTVDAAIAIVATGSLANGTTGLLVDKVTPPDGYGTPTSSTTTAKVGMAVQKYGRTTGLTHGSVYAINATVKVSYSHGIARFVKQIVITPGSFSAAGDSGSLIVTDTTPTQSPNSPVGLLFAGSSTTTIANPIDAVLSLLGIAIDGN